MREDLVRAFLEKGSVVGLSFGMHEGMRGARWVDVFSDGRIRGRTMEASDPWRTLKDPDLEGLMRLVQQVERSPPGDPAHVWTVELFGEPGNWEVHTAPGSLPDLSRALQQLLDGAERPEEPPVVLGASPGFYALWVLGGLFTFGVVSLVMGFAWWRQPVRMDERGVTLRSDRFFAWEELRVEGASLLGPKGERIVLNGLDDTHAAVVAIRRHVRRS